MLWPSNDRVKTSVGFASSRLVHPMFAWARDLAKSGVLSIVSGKIVVYATQGAVVISVAMILDRNSLTC
jgi:hypothetical protein